MWQAPEINDLVHDELTKNSVNLEVLSKDNVFAAVEDCVNKVSVAMVAWQSCPSGLLFAGD